MEDACTVRLTTHDIIILDSICFAPCAHDKGVIVCQHGHQVNLLALDLLKFLNVSWEMADGAPGREGSWHGEEHHLLVCPFLGRIVVHRNATGGDLRGLGRVWNITRV